MTLLLAGCGAGGLSPDPPVGQDRSVGHIHGLGIDPADETLYVATHHGLFHVDDSGRPSRVADRWQDTMAFTVVGPRHFLASGHPDLREDLPAQLGLVESTDAGETWQPLALQGDADLHILEQVGGSLYAYDATSGRLLASEDRTSFREVARLPLLSVTADPDSPAGLLATTNRGELVGIDPGTGSVRGLSGPTLVLLDTSPEGDVVGLDPAGTVQVSADGGRTWTSRGGIDGQPAAFAITGQGWYAATAEHVFRSVDEGGSWSRVL